MTDADPTESTLDDLADADPPKCPSCEVPYIEHLGLHGTCAALQTVTKERDKLRAKLADVDAAIERNARIRRAEWTDEDRLFVADFTSEAAQFLAEMLLARLDMENAPNYAEVSTEDLGSLHVALTGLHIDMCFRRAGAPTPHELRLKAEKERDEALALAEAEDRAWKQHQREIACPAHRWSPMQPGRGERLDGYGVCLDCQRHEADVLPVRTVCARCGATVKLYTGRLCEPCYGACDDAELERIDGRNSLEMRIRARELAHYRATTSPEQQAEDLAVGLAAIFDNFADKETP